MPAKGSRVPRRKKAEKGKKVNIKEKVSEVLDLPKEIVLNIPKLTMVGNSSLIIENYKGVMEYESTRIRVNTGSGIIRIEGGRLTIKGITSENIFIDGDISSIEFIK
ncbi:MAG: sporulation protein YqfC [Clostridiales bacterium]|jgi:sporulation protein YqfC|nr:sporulation protein YqfC [Eubacteriales bacterium]MDH7565338.1 sporulation protein YqfC [Clostridiales bacterium]